jgi:LmbE family N-acetylglucosaminyl deacetylase
MAVSPHLDDAVFGCGELIASRRGAAVVTIFAGIPDQSAPLPEWDACCGFSSAREALAARRQEDAAALRLLGAQPCWLQFLDGQYAPGAALPDISLRLDRELRRHGARTVAIPLGLFHSDHRLAHDAALRLLSRERTWIAYADALYRRIPGVVEARLAALQAGGIAVSPVRIPTPKDSFGKKQRAVACYASQIKGLATAGRPGHADALAAERYWRLSA